MTRTGARIAGLEKRRARRREPLRKGHIVAVMTTEEEALDEYGRDRIGPDDFIVFLVPGKWPEGRGPGFDWDEEPPRS